jgi:hypothetical protein
MAKEAEKDKLIRRTESRNKDKTVDGLLSADKLPPIKTLKAGDAPEAIVEYSYRSFDRQFVILDARLGDRFRPPLIEVQSDQQVFLTTLQSHPLGYGPGITCASYVPDRHIFRGSYSGKDVIPLYRDAAGTEPNVTAGLLDALGAEYGTTPDAEDLAAYVYALLGGQSYTRRFWNELETPGPRVPLTKDCKTFAEAAKLGRKLIWLHTYAERFRGEDRGHEVPQGNATTIKGVSSDPARYPVDYDYDEAKREIVVGDGRFGHVSPQVWEFEVSGLKVVQSWLGYRMKKRAGRKSSPLDEIRPERWTARMSDEFLELLWVLEATLEMEPDLAAALDKVVAGPCFRAEELPSPSDDERKPLAKGDETDDQLSMFPEEPSD